VKDLFGGGVDFGLGQMVEHGVSLRGGAERAGPKELREIWNPFRQI
jgi:hypothetical protein